MSEAVYVRIMIDLQRRIDVGEFKNLKLSDERSLAIEYEVSRSSIKRAVTGLVNQGIIFKKRGSGTFVNPLYLKNKSLFRSVGANLGVSDSFRHHGETPAIHLLSAEKQVADEETRQALFLEPGELVWVVQRLRSIDKKYFMIENALIPVKLIPQATENDFKYSMFHYAESATKKMVSKSLMTVTVEPSKSQDQQMLDLAPNEPVGIMSGIYFLDDGTPYEYGTMRVHYKYMHYTSFVSLDGE
ncbi:GntR family transcriptional regulator [Weissella kandleri]